MAAGPPDAQAFSFRKAFLWTEIFRTFQVAIDPRKLLLAAAGILVMSLGWFGLSKLFATDAPLRADETRYGSAVVRAAVGDKQPSGRDSTEADYNLEAQRLYDRDLEQWKTLDALAGPGGRFSTLPWYEYRGPNPYFFLTALAGGDAAELRGSFSEFLSGTVPVLVEPLVKLLVPVIKLVDPDASPLTRLYLLLCLAWSVVTWAFFGGVITRLAAVQFTGKTRTTVAEAVTFVATRYKDYVLSPMVPVAIIGVVTLVMMLFAFVALIPFVGDVVLYGLGLPLVILGGAVMVVLLIGLVSYPLMYTTLSVEGTDTFDALSRSYNYVFQAPWNFLWYSLVSIFYGAIVTFFVIFAGSLSVYMGKWAVSQAPLSERTHRKPDYLFLYAPETFGWKQLFLKGSQIEQREVPETNLLSGRVTRKLEDVNKPVADQYRGTVLITEKIGAGMASFWLTLFALLIIGFSYSYFWSASTMIYLLMRKKVDDLDPDELYVEEPLPTPSPIQPPGSPPPPPLSPPTTSLPVVPPSPFTPGVPPAPLVPPPPLALPPGMPPFAPPAVPFVPPAVTPEVPPSVARDGGVTPDVEPKLD